MGRPLNSRFFDPAVGGPGEGVSSVSVTVKGNYDDLATVSFDAPSLPGGVTAVGNCVMELRTVAINNAGGSYTTGDVLFIGGGAVVGDTTAGTYTVQAEIVVDTVDGITGAITAFQTLSVRGSYTTLPAKVAGGSNSVNLSLDGGTGNNARVDITWRVLDVDITTSGSGYVDAADAVPTFSTGTLDATGDSVLATTSSNVILAHAFVAGGTTDLDSDIVKQTGTSDYVMENLEGRSICSLVASNSPTEGQAYIVATDSAANTYWVTKLTAHKAVLQQRAGGTWIYPNGYSAPWILGTAANEVVSIESV